MLVMPRSQTGAANGLKYLLLTIVVAALVIGALSLLWPDEPAETADTGPAPQDRPAEPPAVAPVDFQQAEIEDDGPTTSQTRQTGADGASAAARGDTDLFNRGTRKRPLTDGLAGGREAEAPGATTPAPRANAVDAFDFGILDGRVRVGVFGKGPIPDYRASVGDERITIEMPGEFRYVEEFSRALPIEAFGVDSARLMRDARGMRMVIDVTQGLKFEPFLIEDSRGLMVAFEPKP